MKGVVIQQVQLLPGEVMVHLRSYGAGSAGKEDPMFSNNIRNRQLGIALLAVVFFCLAGAASAQEKSAGSAPDQSAGSAAVQANNPLANFTAFNLHNYYIGELTDPDKDANQFWLRFAKPFSVGKTNWLLRASLPINTFPVPPTLDHETGVGDLNVFAAYLIDVGNPKVAFGIGRRSPRRPPARTNWGARSGPRGL